MGEPVITNYGGHLALGDLRGFPPYALHPVVVRAATTFGWNPGDDLVGVLNVAGFAVHAVRWVEADTLAVGSRRIFEHFVDVGGGEILAGTAEFLHAALVADVRIVNDEVRRLIFFVLGAGVVEIGELVEG